MLKYAVVSPRWEIQGLPRWHQVIHEALILEFIMKTTFLTTLFCIFSVQAGICETLYTKAGSDPDFDKVKASGKLPQGKTSSEGFTGSTIRVNHELVETTPESKRPIPTAIKIHTLGNAGVPRDGFKKWSRWYQEDGSTQVFRLFKDEVNTRNERENAARIEAFSELNWKEGAWHEWSGTFTIVKPHEGSIFQSKNSENDWAVQIYIHDSGNVTLNHRRGEDKSIARDMIGKPFRIRVRDNGLNYEVYFNGEKMGEGSYKRPTGKTGFRWGMYMGKKPVKHDAMLFVSGVTIDGKD